jgi:class 3 adenylate cyclase/tetratricopeptide (TPR) repeat protein
MSGLADWLTLNGLARLEDKFAAHDIELDTLDQLTDADLKELGVSIGLRKAFFKALASDPPKTSAPAPRNPPDSAANAIETTQEAEQRQLTIMFCDLVGSTRLSTLVDPETLMEVLRAYRVFCTQCVERFGGNVAKFMGDGVLIYFGYPRAHEDDAERAIRAALAIVRDLASLRSHPDAPLRGRIGIATGLVVVGELIGSDSSQEQMVVGQTPNLAARLQSLAPPDGIIVAPRTHQLTAGLFDFADMGEHVVKGFEEPINVWRVDGESRAESRFDAHRGGRMTPIVGRQREMELLNDRWRATEKGEGQVVVISGDPGVGKSRLTRALREELGGERYVRLSYHCSGHHQTTALYPIIMQFERAADFGPADTVDRKLAKLELLLGKWNAPVAETLPLFASLLSLSTSGRYQPLGLSPAEGIEKTLQALVSRLEGLAAEQPVLCIMEDMHWIDPTSQELINRIVRLVKRSPILVILTARPEYPRSALGEAGNVTWVPLTRLTRAQAFAMVGHCVGDRTLPPGVVEQIVSKADGNPLFVEELTKTVVQSDAKLPSENGATPILLDVPATLHDSLMARLDQMSTTKQVAQMASVIGRTFDLDLLAAMTSMPAQELRGALDRLVAAEVLFHADLPRVVRYEFKHALLQDVAYQSLVKSARQRYHLRLARVLEEQFPAEAKSRPELLAHHFAEAGQPDVAIGYWLSAARRATQRSANQEAIAQIRNGLALLNNLSSPTDRLQKEHQLRLTMIAPLIAVKGYGSAELDETCDRVVSLSKELGDTSAIFPILSSRHAFVSVIGQIDRARQLAEEAVSLAARDPHGEGSAVAGRLLGSSTLKYGDSTSALRILKETLANYDKDRDRGSAFVYGHDHFATCASYLCLAQWHQGDLTEASRYAEQATAHARSLSHLNTLCLALAFTGGFFNGLCGMGEASIVAAEELLALASEHALPLWMATGNVIMGNGLALQGREREGVAQMQIGLAGLESIQIKLFRPMFLAWKAAAQLSCGDIGGGLDAVESAFAIGGGGEHWMDAELFRLRGEFRLRSGPESPDEAEKIFRTALEIAVAQRSKTLELRAAMSLARLCIATDQAATAREVLTPAVSWFNDGPRTPDIDDARQLLHSIS